MKKLIVASLVLGLGFAAPVLAQRKDCGELKSEIEVKIRNNGVEMYTLEIIDMTAEVMEGFKVVGTCDGQTRKIVYKRG